VTTFEKKKFAERLKKQRLESGYERQSDLAKAAGISAQAVSSYEACERLPSAEVLASLSKALGCTADYLVQLEDTAQRENAAVGNLLGLSDKAISKLREFREIAISGKTNATNGRNAADLINFILEDDDYDGFVEMYEELIFSISVFAMQLEEENSEANEIALYQQKIEAGRSGLVAIDPDAAIDFWIRRIGDFISMAIRDGTEKKVNDLSR
jgi:transcriptional regulator with XRE-family HTH domain